MSPNSNSRSWLYLPIRQCLFALSILLLGTLGNAQTRVISLNEAIGLAKKNSEDLQLSQVNSQKRKDQYDEAFGTILPQVSLEATYQRYFKEPVFFGNRVPIQDQAQAGIVVNQLLWAFGRVGNTLKAAQAALEVVKHEKEYATIQVEYITRVAYYTVLLSKDQWEVAKKNLENSQENLRILQRKFRGGRPPQSDLLRLQSDIASTTPLVRTAESQYDQARMTLAQICGLTDYKNLRIDLKDTDQISNYSHQTLAADLRKDHPRIKLLEEQIHYSEKVSKSMNQADLPTLNLTAGYNYAGASMTSVTGDDLNDSVYAALSLKWNIWDGGSTRAKYRQAVSDRISAELQLAKEKEKLNLDLNKKFNDYITLQKNLRETQEAVSLAERTFKISQKRFSSGQTAITEINNNQFSLNQTRLNLANIRYNLLATHAEIELIAGHSAEH